ncbi:hypothetical protein [Geobacter argillaceus]|uniref:hypothetical protein n=1 Tax=Geobacter argillaceus TaxID=345631 RepID=UPI001FEA0DBA|nr:hypothetical protein [Geobacter argillaceus]
MEKIVFFFWGELVIDFSEDLEVLENDVCTVNLVLEIMDLKFNPFDFCPQLFPLQTQLFKFLHDHTNTALSLDPTFPQHPKQILGFFIRVTLLVL